MSQYKVYRLFKNNDQYHISMVNNLLEKNRWYKSDKFILVSYSFEGKSKKIIEKIDNELSTNIFSNSFYYKAIDYLCKNNITIQRVLLENEDDIGDFQQSIDIMTRKLLVGNKSGEELNELISELKWLSQEEDIDINSIDFRIEFSGLHNFVKIEKMGHIYVDQNDNAADVLKLLSECI
ncbi:hypothetical protein HNQ56_004826 [Anaerotaenia torta]|uniref:hypothetical protein n=1 Tax=Anaerotaenia torta TaxID=433293 RepID=UPI003D1E8151